MSRPRSQRYYCRECKARSAGMWHRARGLVCVYCHAPFGPAEPLAPKSFRDRGRVIAREDEPATDDRFITSHPGNPLGPGMPLGVTMREDGESHLEAWMRLVREDPCAYCDQPGGTIDHIEPRSLRRRGLHNWTNFAGSCQRCNESKAAKPLLVFLAYRGIMQREPADQRQRHRRRSGR